MKHLLALAALTVSLTACSYSATLDKEPPTPTIVYVPDAAAIAEAKTDGEFRGILFGAVIVIAVAVCGGLAYLAQHPAQRADENMGAWHRHSLHAAPPAQPPAVVTHNHNYYYDNRTVIVQSPPNSEGRQRARVLIEGDRQTGTSRGPR